MSLRSLERGKRCAFKSSICESNWAIAIYCNASAMQKEVRRKLPLIVFDLDLTLWPFRLDKHMRSPFQYCDSFETGVCDSLGKPAVLVPEVRTILLSLVQKGYKLAIASRIKDIAGAYQLLFFLKLSHFFSFREIYPGCKKHHFRSLQAKSGFQFSEMVFLDDDQRNIRDVSRIGVTALHVPHGITSNDVNQILQTWHTE